MDDSCLVLIKCGGCFPFCISSDFHGGYSDREEPGTGNLIIPFLRDINLCKELKSLLGELRHTEEEQDIEVLSRYWLKKRRLNELAPLSSLLKILRSSRQKEILVPGRKARQLTGWDWTYVINFDRNELGISFGENEEAQWPFEKIPGRHEIYGSLFWRDSDDAMKAQILKLLGRTKDDAEKSSSMNELESIVDWWF